MNKEAYVPIKDAWRMLVRALRHIRVLMPGALPRTFSLAVVKALRPFVAIYVTAWVLNALTSGMPMRRAVAGALIGAGIGCAAALLEAALTSLTHITNGKLHYRTQQEVNRKYLESDFERLEQPEFQKLKLDFTYFFGVPTTRALEFSAAVTTQLLTALIALGTAIPLIWKADARLSAIVALLIAAVVGLSFLIQNKLGKLEYKYMAENAQGNRLFGYMVGLAYNYKIGPEVRMFRAQKLLSHMGRRMSNALYIQWGQDEGGYKAAAEAVTQTAGAAIYIAVALAALGGAFPIGSVVRYVGALLRLSAGLGGLIQQLTSRQLAKELETYFAILDAAPIKYLGTLSTEKRDDAEYDIEFHDVSFKYPGSEQYALRNLNLKLHIGQHLAVVGMNGSGKTTMIKLLCRLYDPTEGRITLNGFDIKKYDLRQYTDLFSVVFQDFKLFSFKAGENVAADTAFDRARVIDCCEKAGYPDVDPDMLLYRNLDENGIEISGGEAQKLALARALYRNAPFMVLDEPTAALDPVAEFEIYTRFHALMAGHTAIYISHRLSSCRFCDDIAVFHEGRLIQRGSHEQLLADAGGKYRALWQSQAQYYAQIE
ncbi:MAG: ABC transporter ATP-binding protein [Christensenellales bacterium]|jgi:ATP-binding cassette subfamily B protein